MKLLIVSTLLAVSSHASTGQVTKDCMNAVYDKTADELIFSLDQIQQIKSKKGNSGRISNMLMGEAEGLRKALMKSIEKACLAKEAAIEAMNAN